MGPILCFTGCRCPRHRLSQYAVCTWSGETELITNRDKEIVVDPRYTTLGSDLGRGNHCSSQS